MSLRRSLAASRLAHGRANLPEDAYDDPEESGLRHRSIAPVVARDASESPVRRAPVSVSRFPYTIGKYFVSEPIASGGMATVHLGVSAEDDRHLLALKRLHPHLTSDEYFTTMLLDEARIAARVRHPNVVATYGADVIDDDLVLVMEYVAGVPLNVVMRTVYPGSVPPRYAAAIVAGALRGLHAAHEALDDHDQPLGIVHRDVSPQNVHVGTDGVARVLDFGIAKAARRIQTTRAGEVKGKLAYMAPEQLLSDAVDRRTDIRAAAVVLWEALCGAPLFHRESEGQTVNTIIDGDISPPSDHVGQIPPALDAIVMRGLAKRREDRFATALEMADALDAVYAKNPVRPREIGQWVASLGLDALREQERMSVELKRRSSTRPPSLWSGEVPVILPPQPSTPSGAFDVPQETGPVPASPETVRIRRTEPLVERAEVATVNTQSRVRSARSASDVLVMLVLMLLAALVGGLLARRYAPGASVGPEPPPPLGLAASVDAPAHPS